MLKFFSSRQKRTKNAQRRPERSAEAYQEPTFHDENANHYDPQYAHPHTEDGNSAYPVNLDEASVYDPHYQQNLIEPPQAPVDNNHYPDHVTQPTHEQLGYASQQPQYHDTGYDTPAPYNVHEPTAGQNLLTVHSVYKAYNKRPVVKGVSVSVARGESVGILGPNGAGKTTVFYMITGLVAPDKGQVFIDGRDATKLPMYRRARLGIGYLPQEASIFRGLTVEQNIRAVLEVVEPSRKQREYELDSLLDEFRITKLRKSMSTALSGGERRRLEIARAVASRPAYMLLDEPFAGIDPLAIGDIRNLVNHLTQRGIGVLITDHNVRETLGMIDRAYIIHDGQVLTEGTPDQIINNEDVRRVYLGDMFS